MHFTVLLFNLILGVIVAKSTVTSRSFQEVTEQDEVGNSFGYKTFSALPKLVDRNHKTLPRNMTYIDIPDNSMHVPFPAEDTTPNRKKAKKNPKRTIQKIIKKGRSKRRFYVNKNAATTSTGAPFSPQDSEEALSQKIDIPTTEPHAYRKKNKKWNDRTYQIPFHKLSSKREQKRIKRKTDRGRDNMFIIQDFDETKFISKETGIDAANVYVKNYL